MAWTQAMLRNQLSGHFYAVFKSPRIVTVCAKVNRLFASLSVCNGPIAARRRGLQLTRAVSWPSSVKNKRACTDSSSVLMADSAVKVVHKT